MDKFRNYDVEFSGLKTGKYEFRFEIDKAFFALFDAEQEFSNPRIVADVLLEKHTTFLDFRIKTTGIVTLVCDITAEDFDYPIKNELQVLVNFGEEYDDSNEEVITIPVHDHAFNVANLIYENVVLAIPMKKISPNATEEDFKIIEKFNASEPIKTEEISDPRWDALKKLKDNN